MSRLESGVRVGLCFVESPDEGAVSVKDVVQALAA